MKALRLFPALVAAALIAPATASAQALPPTVEFDTRYAFAGVVGYDHDVSSGDVDRGYGAAIDPELDRHYAVGLGTAADADIAVVARRSNGEPDTTFAGDGSFGEDVGGDDHGTAIAVLPDHTLRVLGVSGGDIVLLGLRPDGTPLPGFGTGGREIIDLGGVEAPTRMAIDAGGRIAITGSSDGDTFVIVRDAADGSESDFDDLVVTDVAGADRGVDVAWRGSAPLVLIQAGSGALLRAFDGEGDPDPAFGDAGDLSLGVGTSAGGLTEYGGRFWLTGWSGLGDENAFVMRANADGSALQSRQFDMRGRSFAGGEPVSSRGLDLDVARGEPDTLVVVGSAGTGRPRWAAAAFNGLDGDLANMQPGDAVQAIDGGQGEARSLAAGGNGAVAVTGTIERPVSEGGTGNESLGMARLLVDADKQCDLALSIVSPLELTLRGGGSAGVALVARNGGTRACGGSVSIPAPYGMAPATLDTGKLAPGQSVRLTAQVGRPAPYPVEDTVAFTLSAPADVAPGDNVARLHVEFRFCDLRLVAAGTPRFIGNEGTRRYGFTVRNAGTETCRATSIAVGGLGARSGRAERYTVPAGQSVTDELQVRVRRAARPGARAAIAFTAIDAAELLPADNTVLSNPMVVRAGDSRARRPTGARRFSGTAENGRARGVRKRTLRVDHVEIAVRKAGKGCRWLSSARGDLRRVTPAAGGACDEPVWVRVGGKTDWQLRLARKLPKGSYTLLSRAVTANGVAEGRFGFQDKNKLRFRIR